MTILSAQTIRECATRYGMIYPFFDKKLQRYGRSYGLSACSYDVCLAQTLWVWPLWGRLGSTIEWVGLPAHIAGHIRNKSSNARNFICVDNTHIDPGFRGHITIEITRHKPWPVRIKKGTPIAQIIFELLDAATDRPYEGKYQHQADRPVKAIHE